MAEKEQKHTLFTRSFNDGYNIDEWKPYSDSVALQGTCIILDDDTYDDWHWSDKIYVAAVRVAETLVRRATDTESGHSPFACNEVQEPQYEYICLVNDKNTGQYLVFSEDGMRNLHEHGHLEFPPDPIAWLGLRDGPRLVA